MVFGLFGRGIKCRHDLFDSGAELARNEWKMGWNCAIKLHTVDSLFPTGFIPKEKVHSRIFLTFLMGSGH